MYDKSFFPRPAGSYWQSPESQALMKHMMHPDLVWRGMTDQEYQATVGRGLPVLSRKDFSHSSEGTSFSDDPGIAEDYANVGRDDPRKTGKPTWLVAVKRTPSMYKDRDYYIKAKGPVPAYRVWRMSATPEGAIIAEPVAVRAVHEATQTDRPPTFEQLLKEVENPHTRPERLAFIYTNYGSLQLPDNPNHHQITQAQKDATFRLYQRAELLAAIASNPNTPAEVVLKSAYHHPDAVLKNPALLMHGLEDPDFVNKMEHRLGSYPGHPARQIFLQLMREALQGGANQAPLREAFQTTFQLAYPGRPPRTIDVYRNPSSKELAEINRDGAVSTRALIDAETVFIWNANQAIHDQVVKRLPPVQKVGVTRYGRVPVYLTFASASAKEVWLKTDAFEDISWVVHHPYFVSRRLKVHLPVQEPRIELDLDVLYAELDEAKKGKHTFKGSYFANDDGSTRFSVERVIEFVSKEPSYLNQNYPVSKLEHDLVWWEKDKSEDRDAHMRSVDTKYPVLVVVDDDGGLSVADGLNRLKKRVSIEKERTIPAYLVPMRDIKHLAEKVKAVTEAKKSDIGLPNLADLSKEEIERAYAGLSEIERKQLGMPVGKSSFVSQVDWPRQRAYMLQKSLHANPHTDPELTAYTPGETTKLLQHPKIVEWHNTMSRFTVPAGYDAVIFVPCAKSKPWVGPACSASLYTHYNALRQKFGNIYFVTISEPLGVVPQDRWGDFPQYDNPGLFKDPVLRSDMFTADWQRLYPGTQARLQTPFDPAEYQKAIDILAGVIKSFISHNKASNPKLRFLSFVEEPEGRSAGTHSDMMRRAGYDGDSFEKAQKRGASKGREPMEYLMTTLKKAGVVALKENEKEDTKMTETSTRPDQVTESMMARQIYDNKPVPVMELRAKASNPSTPSVVLTGLFERYGRFLDGASPDYFQLLGGERIDLRASIAANANTTVDTLLQIGVYEPQAILTNPKLMQHLMDNPALGMQIRDLFRNDSDGLAVFQGVLDSLLALPSEGEDEALPDVMESVFDTGSGPDSPYEKNMANFSRWMQAAENPATPSTQLDDVYREAQRIPLMGSMGKLERALAKNPNISMPLMLKLVRSQPRTIATNPAIGMSNLENPAFARQLAMVGGGEFTRMLAQYRQQNEATATPQATALSPHEQLTNAVALGQLVLPEAHVSLFKKAKSLDESPITGFTTVGDFEKSSAFSNPVDRKLLTSPKGVEKIKHKWENTKFNFNMYFVNKPQVNNIEFREVGEVDINFVRWKMKLDMADFPGPRPDAINIIYTGNSGAERVPMTAWVIGHRLGHALRLGGGETSKRWNEYTKTLEQMFFQIFDEVYEKDLSKSPWGGPSQNTEKVFKYAAMVIGTMKSARDGNLRTWGEFAFELLSQYLLTGEIRFGELPRRLKTGVGPWGRETSVYTDDDINRDMMSSDWLPYLAQQLQAQLELVLRSAVGKIFVM